MLIGFNFFNRFESVLNLGTNEFLINGEKIKMKSSDARLTATIEITENESMTEEEVEIIIKPLHSNAEV